MTSQKTSRQTAAGSAAQAFFGSILDYAGMFPPARLPLAEALLNYLDYRSSRDAALLGRFIVGVGGLDEVVEVLGAARPQALAPESPGGAGPLRCAALLKLGAVGITEAAAEIEKARETIGRCEQALPALRVDCIETDLPRDGATASWANAVERFLAELETRLLVSANPERQVFLELDWRGDYEPVMERIAGRGSWFGVKLRTGGLSAGSIPPAAALARFLDAAARFRLPLKATAGLHAPVPNYDASVGARMHGFLNFFGAAMAAYGGKAGQNDLVRILEEFDYGDFRFEETVLRLGDVTSFTAPEIRELRSRWVCSFGSCSFREPLEHLHKHGMLRDVTKDYAPQGSAAG